MIALADGGIGAHQPLELRRQRHNGLVNALDELFVPGINPGIDGSVGLYDGVDFHEWARGALTLREKRFYEKVDWRVFGPVGAQLQVFMEAERVDFRSSIAARRAQLRVGRFPVPVF